MLVTPPVSPQTSHLLNCCGSLGSERLRLPVPLPPGDTLEVPLVVKVFVMLVLAWLAMLRREEVDDPVPSLEGGAMGCVRVYPGGRGG